MEESNIQQKKDKDIPKITKRDFTLLAVAIIIAIFIYSVVPAETPTPTPVAEPSKNREDKKNIPIQPNVQIQNQPSQAKETEELHKENAELKTKLGWLEAELQAIKNYLREQAQANQAKESPIMEIQEITKRLENIARMLEYNQQIEASLKRISDFALEKLIPGFHFWGVKISLCPFHKELQLESYEKEIGMPRDVEEIAQEVFPKSLQARENKGREKGKAEEKKAIARKMLRKGLATGLIAELTGLTPEEIARLTQE